MPQVSVIVLTYNPNNTKLRQTLSAIASQKDIDFELIISDDGSTEPDFSFLPAYMQLLDIHDYQLLLHQKNQGTVQNCLSAVTKARGEYVFLTSPGDFLFDSYVLRDFYQFAKENNAPLCFGNAVFYNSDNGNVKITRKHGTPACPQLFSPEKALSKIAFFGNNWVIGASYFRSRKLMLDCLKQISDTSVYMEDTPTTAFALAAGHSLSYFDRNIVWYEDGTGVSTGVSEKWKERLNRDVLKSFAKLKNQYPADPYVDIGFCNLSEQNRLKRITGKLLRHPIITIRLLWIKKAKKAVVRYTAADIQRLSQLLETK